MLIRDIRWKGDDVEIELYEPDGERWTVRLPIAEVIDIQTWLTQERARILDAYRRVSKQQRRKDFVE
jgi:hypothetical protein